MGTLCSKRCTGLTIWEGLLCLCRVHYGEPDLKKGSYGLERLENLLAPLNVEQTWDWNCKARYFRSGQCCLLGPANTHSLEQLPIVMGSAYPSKFLVLQGQDACALCKQLHLHSRQCMCCGEVTLGAPAVDRMREVSVENSALTILNWAAFFLCGFKAMLTRGIVGCHILLSKAARVTKSVN